MKKYNVTFTTYEEYEVEAENELRSDRCCPIADTHYDESDVEEIEE